MIRDSVEYLTFTLVDRDGADLTGDTVTVALVARSDTGSPTFLACTHETGTTWRTTNPVTWSLANYPHSTYRVLGKLVDSPETPLVNLGVVNIL